MAENEPPAPRPGELPIAVYQRALGDLAAAQAARDAAAVKRAEEGIEAAKDVVFGKMRANSKRT